VATTCPVCEQALPIGSTHRHRAEAILFFEESYLASREEPLSLGAGGYRADLVPEGTAEMLGVEVSRGPEDVRPMEEVTVELRFLHEPLVSYALLRSGAAFRILDGAKLAATGEIEKVWPE